MNRTPQTPHAPVNGSSSEDVYMTAVKDVGYVIDNCSSRMLNFSGTTEKHPEV